MMPNKRNKIIKKSNFLNIPQTKNSIMQNEKKCYITGKTENLHKHHIYFGRNRNISDKYGLWIWLIGEYHNQNSRIDIHHNINFDLQIKEECQKIFEQTYTHEQFIHLIGKSYL